MSGLSLGLPLGLNRSISRGLPLNTSNAVPSIPVNIVWEGDSITAGYLANNNSFANQYTGVANFSVINSTITGAAPSLTNRAASVDAKIVPGLVNVLVVMTGNDMLLDTAALQLSRFATYLDDRGAAGWNKRIVLSTLPRTTVGFNAKRATANAGLPAFVGVHCETFIDLDTTSIGADADASNVAKYSDGIHPTIAGQDVIFAVVAPVLDALIIPNPGPPSTNLIEHWKLNTGLTQSGGLASSWKGRVQSFNLIAAGGNRPAVQGDGSLLFDGVTSSGSNMQATFAWVPKGFTVFLQMKQVTWISTDGICDGGINYSGALFQYSSGRGLQAYQGTFTAQNDDLVLNTWATVAYGLSTALDIIQVDANAVTSGSGVAATDMNGFTVGSNGSKNQNANIQVKEILLYRGVLDATARAAVRAYLATVP